MSTSMKSCSGPRRSRSDGARHVDDIPFMPVERCWADALAAAAFPLAAQGQQGATRPVQEPTDVRIRMTFNDLTLTATLYDNPSARDLASMLPLNLKIEDYGRQREDRPSAAQADRGRQRSFRKRAAGRPLLLQAMGQPRPVLRRLPLGRADPSRPLRQRLRAAAGSRRVPGPHRTDLNTPLRHSNYDPTEGTTHDQLQDRAGRLACVPSPAFANDSKSPIIGAWRMTSLQVTDASGQSDRHPVFRPGYLLSRGNALRPGDESRTPPQNRRPTPRMATRPIMARSKSTKPRRPLPSPWNRPWSAISSASDGAQVRGHGDQLVITPADPKEGWRVTYDRF